MRIGVLDSDRSQLDLMCKALGSAGHVCHSFGRGKDLLIWLHRESIDMLVLDWNVPDTSGEEILRSIKDTSPNLPVLLVIAHGCQDEIATALVAGADDYLIKPIRRTELAVRVQVLLHRAYPEQQAEKIQFGRYSFDTGARRLLMNNQPIELTQKEFVLALFLFNNLDRPLSRATIHDAVWSSDIDIPSRTVDTHISRVRSKLQLRAENGFRLVPVYSYGYRLEQI